MQLAADAPFGTEVGSSGLEGKSMCAVYLATSKRQTVLGLRKAANEHRCEAVLKETVLAHPIQEEARPLPSWSKFTSPPQIKLPLAAYRRGRCGC